MFGRQRYFFPRSSSLTYPNNHYQWKTTILKAAVWHDGSIQLLALTIYDELDNEKKLSKFSMYKLKVSNIHTFYMIRGIPYTKYVTGRGRERSLLKMEGYLMKGGYKEESYLVERERDNFLKKEAKNLVKMHQKHWEFQLSNTEKNSKTSREASWSLSRTQKSLYTHPKKLKKKKF